MVIFSARFIPTCMLLHYSTPKALATHGGIILFKKRGEYRKGLNMVVIRQLESNIFIQFNHQQLVHS